jgi:putative oxidoreductase
VTKEVLDMDTGLLILRVAFGLAFAAHGAQKLFGWFKGYGVKGTGGFLESLGFRPGRLVAASLGATEIVGGLLLAGGLFTPLAGAIVIGVMINAIFIVKRREGFLGGYELEFLYLVAGLAAAFVGPGEYALDALAGWSLNGSAWGLGALALGVVTAVLAMASRRPAAPAVAPATEERRAA